MRWRGGGLLRSGLQALVVVSVALAASLDCSAGIDLRPWSHRARIDILAVQPETLYECPLTPEILDKAKTDLSDLRIVDENGEELGYVLRVAPEKTVRQPLQVKLYNRTSLPGESSSVTVDFGAKVLKNRIVVATSGNNFRRKLRVEGSDDGVGWQVIRDAVFLFRIQLEPGQGDRYDKSDVKLPENDWRYLRLTVLHGPEDPATVEIDDVKAWQVVEQPAETAEAPISSTKIVTKGNVTEITLDLGVRNLLLYRLGLGIADENFARAVTVSGRMSEETVVRRPVEDAAAQERRVKVPWSVINRGTLHRYAAGSERQEGLAIDLAAAKYRHLLMQIFNRNDPPLGIEQVTVQRLKQFVAFRTRSGEGRPGVCFLHVGNSEARQPGYDLVGFSDRLRAKGVVSLSLGALESNPAFAKADRVVPWSERHAALLWVALALMLAVLALVVFRMIRRAPSSPSSPQ